MATYLSSVPNERPPYPISTPPTGIFTPINPNQPINCNIHASLDLLPAEGIIQLIRQDANVVHEKGFSGLSPLHRAALRGDAHVVQAMIDAGADLNARNDFEETPLHFASKRGNPHILHMLIEQGADITATDKLGKNAMHHAAEGGSVYGMHYLVDVKAMATHVLDHNLHTPLHIACARGHVEAFLYLIKKERSDLYQRDKFGNNSLHLAAKFGHQGTCWKLLELTGVKLVHETNKDGCTPLDLARKGDCLNFRKIQHMLEGYSRIRDRTYRVSGPVVQWYLQLLAPFAFYPGLLMVSSLADQSGWVVILGLISCLIYHIIQEHRLYDISRWPNPFYAGLFAAGLIYSTASYFVNVLPYIYYDYRITSVLSILLTPVGFYTYFLLLYRDPGVVRHSAEKEDIDGYYSMRDIAQGSVMMEAFCVRCETVPVLRTRHCKLCELCYADHDHHCLFLYKCVAGNNRWLFVVFNLFVLAGCLGYEVMALVSMGYLYPADLVGRDLAFKVFHRHCWLWSFMLIDAFTIYQTLLMLQVQFDNISKGHTVSFKPFAGKTDLTAEERGRNVTRYLLGKQPVARPDLHMRLLFDCPEARQAFNLSLVQDMDQNLQGQQQHAHQHTWVA